MSVLKEMMTTSMFTESTGLQYFRIVGDIKVFFEQIGCLAYCSFCFFFFQAEDGIRDLTVTGVQTCALPIYASGYIKGQWNGLRSPSSSSTRWRICSNLA